MSRANVQAPASLPGRGQRILTFGLWGLLICVMIVVIARRAFFPAAPPPVNLPVLFDTPRFSLIDQEGKPFSNDDLRGKVYICDFIFTTCGSICPLMTGRMERLQSATPAAVQLVSFTVNPQNDTPPVLKSYAIDHHADLKRWHFLTGSTKQMTDVVSGMKLPFKPVEGSDPILHSENFLLVDQSGAVRGVYHSDEADALRELAKDAARLAAQTGAHK